MKWKTSVQAFLEDRPRAALTVLRVALSVLIAAHGWARWLAGGVEPFALWLGEQGLPLGMVVAAGITALEILGTPLLAVGRLVRPLCLLYAAIYAVGIVLVHAPAGWFVVGLGRNGMEYSVLLIVCLLCVGLQRTSRPSKAAVVPLLLALVATWLVATPASADEPEVLFSAGCGFFGETGLPPAKVLFPDVLIRPDGEVIVRRQGRLIVGQIPERRLAKLRKYLEGHRFLQRTRLLEEARGEPLLVEGGMCFLDRGGDDPVLVAAYVRPTAGPWRRILERVERDLPETLRPNRSTLVAFDSGDLEERLAELAWTSPRW